MIRLYKALIKKDRSNEIIARQLARSGTSIGANLEEAAGAQSRADFISKCHIALKEARECYYWLRLLVQTEVIPKKSAELLIQESNELVSILTCIVKNTRNNNPVMKS
ncbi:MAG TPA: four helix bundle protein [Anaerohalosphaeraceae bacterium]|nr:four helix bundle protein [Anaerohalosphaeraceae bacterium]